MKIFDAYKCSTKNIESSSIYQYKNVFRRNFIKTEFPYMLAGSKKIQDFMHIYG